MHKNKTMFELKTLSDYSDESLINELRRVAELCINTRLTRKRFDQISRVHSSTLERRFGSWNTALDRAGISESIAPRSKLLKREMLIDALKTYAHECPGASVNLNEIAKRLGVARTTLAGRFGKWEDLLAEVGLTPVQRRYSDEDCYENVITLWTHYGRQPHFAELNKPPSTVGSKAYVGRWGGWRAALHAFIKYVNQEPDITIQSHEELAQIESSSQNITVSRSISLAVRYKVLCRDRFRCVICGRSPAKDINIELHIDHIVPWSKGGQNIEENLRILCSVCNLGKGAKNENA
jgi:hypothetical protein